MRRPDPKFVDKSAGLPDAFVDKSVDRVFRRPVWLSGSEELEATPVRRSHQWVGSRARFLRALLSALGLRAPDPSRRRDLDHAWTIDRGTDERLVMGRHPT